MTLLPRYPAANSQLLAKDRAGFPPKSASTFGEVVSNFNKYGNVAAKRHGGVYVSQHTHLPNKSSSIYDKTLNMRDSRESSQDRLDRMRLSRGLTGSRSRTPSPWANGRLRPRSLPVTPRSSLGPGQQRLIEPRQKDWAELDRNGVGDGGYRGRYAGGDRGADGYPDVSGAYTGGHVPISSMEPLVQGPVAGFSRGAPGGTGHYGVGGSSRSLTSQAGGGSGSCSSTVRHNKRGESPRGSPGRAARLHEPAHLGYQPQPQQPPMRPAPPGPPPLWSGADVSNQGAMRGPSDTPGKEQGGNHEILYQQEPIRFSPGPYVHEVPVATSGNPRVASFVRLNGFLLRTHITSLISALAEDGWLETWEKERLCNHARDSDGSSPWARIFLRIYTQFMETNDVAGFVTGLRSEIASS
eukprot:TRINITY_DN16800_c0_g2_i1.p1 TRINITY_DN16800_c0_g2~~TRINITY_DN16800_c0_g2_i1.p1  ORF type:complete len:411 (+),score=65.32 TRINITY_DN16800_c0_g2_i1:46-1278(+)